MDFTELTYEERLEFLNANGVFPSLYDNVNQEVEKLFTRLEKENAQTFTEPVIDLWKAYQAKPFIDENLRYDKAKIENLSESELKEFSDFFGVSDKNRILRILNYLHVLYPINHDKAFGLFENAFVYYKIEVDFELDTEITEDQLWRHVIDGLDSFKITYMETKKIESSWFLVLKLEFSLGDQMDEEYLEANNNKIVIPSFFMDSVAKITDEGFDFVDDVRYTFDHIKTSDQRLLDWIRLE